MYFEIIGQIAEVETMQRFVICIHNDGCEDLETGKVYRVVPDERPGSEGFLRVIDESGEDYLYPAGYFVAIALPQAAEQALFTLAAA